MLSEALAWSCTGPCEKIWKRSWWNPLGVLAWSPTGLCGKILCRSCWSPPEEVLALRILRSWRCSAVVLVWKFFSDAHRKFVYEDLDRSCKILYIESPSLTIFRHSLRCPGMRFCYEALMSRHSLASCAKTSSCCCSSDNVLFHSYCCLHLVHWLPTPHTAWGLLPV